MDSWGWVIQVRIPARTAHKQVSIINLGYILIESMTVNQPMGGNLKVFATLLGDGDLFDRAFEKST